jgi:hypothetical protein
MNIQEEFEHRCSVSSGGHADMRPHMHQLRDLAAECTTACEFGVRSGNSTAAILAGLAKNGGGKLWSFDMNPPQCAFPETGGVQWVFEQANTATLPVIPPCDLLFIDTLHTGPQVAAELQHARSVRRYIAFHDVVMFGWQGEGGDGILPAIFDFLAEDDQWKVHAFFPSTWGMLVLRRDP